MTNLCKWFIICKVFWLYKDLYGETKQNFTKGVVFIITEMSLVEKKVSSNGNNKIDVDDELQFSVLLDFYSEMLTEKQRDVIDLYYNEDLSLSEIAEHENITRQGVRDSIKRGEQTLLELESKFKLAAKAMKFYEIIDEVKTLSDDICKECAYHGNPKKILRRAEYMSKLAEENRDLF